MLCWDGCSGGKTLGWTWWKSNLYRPYIGPDVDYYLELLTELQIHTHYTKGKRMEFCRPMWWQQWVIRTGQDRSSSMSGKGIDGSRWLDQDWCSRLSLCLCPFKQDLLVLPTWSAANLIMGKPISEPATGRGVPTSFPFGGGFTGLWCGYSLMCRWSW